MVANSTIKGAEKSSVTAFLGIVPSINIHITILKALQIISQFLRLFAFFGAFISTETGNAEFWNPASQEPFAAVGQWGNVMIVLLVLTAAMIGRLWTGKGVGNDNALSDGGTCITGDTEFERRDGKD